MSKDKYPIYLVLFPNQHAVMSTCMRFQEHYESPHFRGKAFSREQYEDWYAKRYGAFTYYKDWSGANFPPWVFQPFRDGEFNPLTEKEKALLNMFRGVKEPFYVIGAEKGDLGTVVHEGVHGLFCVFPDYGRDVIECMRHYDTSKMRKALSGAGYCRQVQTDEINAYLLTGISEEFSDLEYRPLQRYLHKVFEKHMGYPIRDKANKERFARRIHKIRFKMPK